MSIVKTLASPTAVTGDPRLHSAPLSSAPSLTVQILTPGVPLYSIARPNLTVAPLSPKFTQQDLPPDIKEEDLKRLTERHQLERLPPTEKKKYPSKRCKVCLRRSGYTPNPGGKLPARKHPKESVYHCPQCPSKPGLCAYPCYYLYHSKLHYWETGDAEGEGDGAGAGFVTLGGGRGTHYGEGGSGSGGGGGGEYSYGVSPGFNAPAQDLGSGGNMRGGAYEGGAYEDVEEAEHKFCPLPVYGESVYGPGGR